MKNSKIKAYLGFCVRARKIVFGVDDVEKQRRGVFLLIADEALGNSSLKTVIKMKEQLGCPLLVAKQGVLGELLTRPAVKAVAIKDENLASAVLSAAESESQFKLYSGGNNGTYGKEV